MKKLPLLLFLLTSTLTSFSQSLFFDNLKNSTWTTEVIFNDSTIREPKKIGLAKLSVPKDSLKQNCTIWTFTDQLTITSYNAKTKTEQVIATYKYEPDAAHGLLKITFDDKTTFAYKAGIVATGNFVLLIKQKPKKI